MLSSGPAGPQGTSDAALSLQVSPTPNLDQQPGHDVSTPLLNGPCIGPTSHIPISDWVFWKRLTSNFTYYLLFWLHPEPFFVFLSSAI